MTGRPMAGEPVYVMVLLLAVALAVMTWAMVFGHDLRVTVTCPTGQTVATVHHGSRTEVWCG